MSAEARASIDKIAVLLAVCFVAWLGWRNRR